MNIVVDYGAAFGLPLFLYQGKGKGKNMLKLKAAGKEYTIKFGYRVLAKTTLVQEVIRVQNMFSEKNNENEDKDENEENERIAENLPSLISINSRLVLAGLQKCHKEEFGTDFDDQDSVSAGLEKVYDLMDDYMDEEDSLPIFDLFGTLVSELTDNGFLSKKSPEMEQAATEQDATVIPQDHLRSVN